MIQGEQYLFALEQQLLFEIVMAVGNGTDLHVMLQSSLSVMMRKLGCNVGVVVCDADGAKEIVHSIPHYIKNCSNILSICDRSKEAPSWAEQLFLIEQEGLIWMAFTMPGYGQLVLGKVGAPFSRRVLGSLTQIAQKLATSCIVCEQTRIIKEEKNIAEKAKLEAEAAIRAKNESEEKFRVIFEAMSEGVIMRLADGKIAAANPSAERMMGGTHEEMMESVLPDRIPWKTIHEDGTPFTPETYPVAVTLETGKFCHNIVMGVPHKGGTLIWLSINSMPLFRKGEDKPYAAVTTLNDITARKKIEDEVRKLNSELEQRVQDRTRSLAESEERMRLFFERPLIGMAITSPAKGWIKVNDKACEMLGYSREELMQRNWADLTHPEDLAANEYLFDRMMKGEIDNYTLEKRFIRKDGGVICANLSVACVRKPDGSVDCLMTLIEDITKRKQAEENIQKLNQELRQRATTIEASNQELEAFSYSVSHDLRIPLRAIDGFSRILLEDYEKKIDKEGKRLLNVIRDNTVRMATLIDDILAFSRVGRKDLALQKIDMAEMVKAVMTELSSFWAGRDVKLEVGPLPTADGDPTMIHQVWVNLLNNAIKFTRPRKKAVITVGGYRKGSENTYYIKDNGVGFDMRYVEKLFGVFQRLHSSSEFEGTGIGLAIIKSIVNRHEGKVWGEGKVDEGATFYFTLPIVENEHG